MQRCMGCMEWLETEAEGLSCPHCGYIPGTPQREAYHLPPETILSGRYVIGRVLGYGGFGVTYMGFDQKLERKVAIKEFMPSMLATRMPGTMEISVYQGEASRQFEEGLIRFVEEAERLARFQNVPGIVDIYDTFVDNSTGYIVMEYLEGQDIKQLMKANGTLPVETARDIVLAVCETLKAVHKEGMIHRDISPDNIYLTKEGGIKLIDFGAARYETSKNSKSLSVILKSGYAPEEQYRSHGQQGPWTDVYALAATFYKMITGETPKDSMERAIKDELLPPSVLGIELPEAVEHAILNGLVVRSAERVQTIEAWQEALLCDQVKLIKVKKTKSDSGAFPVWGKVLLIGTGVSLLAFGLLTATGVIGSDSMAMLADTFGSGLQEGYVNAPGVVNSTRDEAEEILSKEGLDLLVVGKEYSGKIENGKILTQQPLPGRTIALGKAVEVTICAGEQEALAEDEIPDVTLLTLEEAEKALSPIKGLRIEKRFRFDEQVKAGLVLTQEMKEGGINEILLTVSLGPEQSVSEDKAPPMPYMWLEAKDDMVYIHYLMPAPGEDTYAPLIACHSGGEAWTWLVSVSPKSETVTVAEAQEGYEDIYTEEVLMNQISSFGTKQDSKLRIMGETYGKETYGSSDGFVIPYEIEVDKSTERYPAITVDSVEETTLSEQEKKELTKQYGISSTEEAYPYRLKGSFQKGQSYYIYEGAAGMGKNRRVTSLTEGELLLLSEKEFDGSSVLAGFYPLYGSGREENGSYYLHVGRNTVVDGSTMVLDGDVGEVKDREVLDVIKEIGDNAGAFRYQMPYAFLMTDDEEVKRGSVIDFYLEGDQNNGEIYELNVQISMGSSSQVWDPMIIPIQWQPDEYEESEEASYPQLCFFTIPGEDRSAEFGSKVTVRVEVSNDAGKTWHMEIPDEDNRVNSAFIFEGRSGKNGYISPEGILLLNYKAKQFANQGLIEMGDRLMLRLTPVDERDEALGDAVTLEVPMMSDIQ